MYSDNRRRLLATLLLLSATTEVRAADLPTPEKALALAFADAVQVRESHFLDAGQQLAVEQLGRVEVRSALVTRYVVSRDSKILAWAYLDTHRVRTLPETLMVIIDPENKVTRIEVISFREPPEYLPPSGWYRQFTGHELSAELGLKRGIRPITGATLSARAATDAVRRVLAIHQILQGGDR